MGAAATGLVATGFVAAAATGFVAAAATGSAAAAATGFVAAATAVAAATVAAVAAAAAACCSSIFSYFFSHCLLLPSLGPLEPCIPNGFKVLLLGLLLIFGGLCSLSWASLCLCM